MKRVTEKIDNERQSSYRDISAIPPDYSTSGGKVLMIYCFRAIPHHSYRGYVHYPEIGATVTVSICNPMLDNLQRNDTSRQQTYCIHPRTLDPRRGKTAEMCYLVDQDTLAIQCSRKTDVGNEQVMKQTNEEMQTMDLSRELKRLA